MWLLGVPAGTTHLRDSSAVDTFCKQIAFWNAFHGRQLENRGPSKLPIFLLLHRLLTHSSKRQVVLQNSWRKASQEQMWNGGGTSQAPLMFCAIPSSHWRFNLLFVFPFAWRCVENWWEYLSPYVLLTCGDHPSMYLQKKKAVVISCCGFWCFCSVVW